MNTGCFTEASWIVRDRLVDLEKLWTQKTVDILLLEHGVEIDHMGYVLRRRAESRWKGNGKTGSCMVNQQFMKFLGMTKNAGIRYGIVANSFRRKN